MGEPETQEQILDAAFEAMTTFGLARLSLADVAKRANLSRQTLYRYFRTKTDLLDAVVAREEQRFLDRIVDAAEGKDVPEEALQAAVAATLDGVRSHPLVQRLLETEPEALVPYLTQGGLPGPRAVDTVTRLLAGLFDDVDPADARRASEVLCRLIISYVLDPFDEPIDAFADWLVDLLLHGIGSDRTRARMAMSSDHAP